MNASLVHSVNNVDATEAVELLQELFAGSDIRLSVDERTNSVIARGTGDELLSISQMLQTLDMTGEKNEPKAEQPTAVQLRLVWLVSGHSSEDEERKDATLPMGLTDVVEGQLSSLGVKGLVEVGQLVVRTVTGERFQLEGHPVIDDMRAQWSIEGHIVVDFDTPHVDMGINASSDVPGVFGSEFGGVPGDGAQKPREWCSLQTIVVAPFGQLVVLSVSPAGEDTSVFVLEVTAR